MPGVPGSGGPPPKRSSQRRRRNKPSGPPPRSGKGSGRAAWASYAAAMGLDVPDDASRAQIMDLVAGAVQADEWHPLAVEWWESLRLSGQATWYEPSDWATARVLAELLSRILQADELNATAVRAWQHGATELLTTEGARRRVRVELEQAKDDATSGGDNVSEIDQWRRRLRTEG